MNKFTNELQDSPVRASKRGYESELGPKLKEKDGYRLMSDHLYGL